MAKKKTNNKESMTIEIPIEIAVAAVCDRENWLYQPENKEFLERILKSLEQQANIDRGSFSQYLPCPLNHVPNEKTAKAIRDARKGNGLARKKYDNTKT